MPDGPCALQFKPSLVPELGFPFVAELAAFKTDMLVIVGFFNKIAL